MGEVQSQVSNVLFQTPKSYLLSSYTGMPGCSSLFASEEELKDYSELNAFLFIPDLFFPT